jgi:hypothetical protein
MLVPKIYKIINLDSHIMAPESSRDPKLGHIFSKQGKNFSRERINKKGWSSRTENPADLKSSRFVNPADLIRVSAGFQRQRISTLANKRLPDFYFFHFLFFAKNQNSFRKVWREQFLQFSRLWFPKRTRAGNKSIIILILLGSKISSF